MKADGSKFIDRTLRGTNIVMVVCCVFDSIYYLLKAKHVVFPVLTFRHVSTLEEARNLSDAVINRAPLADLPYNLLIMIILCNLAYLLIRKIPRRVFILLLICTMYFFVYIVILH